MNVPKRDSMKFLKWASRQKENSEIRDRIRAIILARKGATIEEISSKLDFCPRWVQTWVARYRDGGFEGLRDKLRSGAPRHLSPEQEDAFVDRIFQGSQTHDSARIFHVWDIQKILRDEFQAQYSRSGVYAILARLKLVWITSRPRHEFNDFQKMENWKEAFKAKFKETKKKFPDKKIQIWFQDESRFGQQGNLYRIWTKKGFRFPMIKQQGFKFAYLLGAVNPKSGQHVGLVFEDLDTEVVNVHLDLISKAVPSDVHVILIWDQAGYHKSKNLNIPENITPYRLEPYSPELNPVEKIWWWLKTNHLGNSIFKGVENLFQVGMDAWEKLKDHMLTSMCRVKWLPRTD